MKAPLWRTGRGGRLTLAWGVSGRDLGARRSRNPP